jgi:hypothetical protein
MPALDPVTLVSAVRITHPGTAIGSEVTSFSIQISPLGSKIGDTVWHDINRNGVQDAGEPGIEGVTVDLLDSAGYVLDTVTTDANGNYEFYGLTAGDYFVDVDENTLPAGFTPTAPFIGDTALDSNGPLNGLAAPISLLTDSDVDITIDFGYVSPCTGKIGDTLWHDTNRNGMQDAGEPGIEGAAIHLLDSLGNVINTVFTGANGRYMFAGLCSGNYHVDVDETTLPAGFTPTTPFAGDTAIDSNGPLNGGAVPVAIPTESSVDLTIDFGYLSPCTGMIGDFVWHDTNRNGIQDNGEPGISGVSMVLADGFGNTAVTTTAADGSYVFTGLCSGNYSIDADETTMPPGFTPTTPFAGNPALDSNGPMNGGAASVSLSGGSTIDLSIDFGYISPCTGMIGDLAWHDANRNGLQDAGEPGISGVRVILKDYQGAQIGETLTDALGFYEFTGLCAGDYFVDVDENTVPAGMIPAAPNQGGNDAVDSDEPADGTPIPVSLGSDTNNNPDIDFGFNKPVVITLDLIKYVSKDGVNWFDANDATGLAICLCPAAGSEHDDDGSHDDKDDKHSSSHKEKHGKHDREDDNHDGSCNDKDDKHSSSHKEKHGKHDREDDNHDGSHDDKDDKHSSSHKEKHGKHDREDDNHDASGCGGNSGSSSGNTGSCGNVYYKFVLRNTGDVDLTGIRLSDSIYTLGGCAVPPVLTSGTTFSCAIGPFAARTGTHTNSATASGTYGTTTVSDTDIAIYTGSSCDTSTGGCVRSPGYWKNHPDAWPVSSITIGGKTYSRTDAISLMNKEVRGDKTYTLFRALVSARLNVLAGANSSCITDTITAADAWMRLHRVGSAVTGDRDAWKIGEPLYIKLDDYNNGKGCAKYCGS